jgi:formylglycine-generating enzyme required for sulfatase activity
VALLPFCKGADLAALVQAATDPGSSPARIQLPSMPTARPRLPKQRMWPMVVAAVLGLLAAGIYAAMFQPQPEEKTSVAQQPAAVAGKGVNVPQQRQQQWAEKLALKVQQQNSLGMELTLIPPGEFDMGSSAEEVQRAIASEQREVPEGWPMHYFIRKVQVELPAHKVKLTRPFLMGTHEVTVAQWDAFVKESGYKRFALREPDRFGDEGFGRGQKKPDDDAPMTFVNWDDAQAFCSWLSTKEEKTYRLPTEAEWEYACRAGTTTTWFSGEEVGSLRDYAWTLQSGGKVRDPEHNSADVRPQPVGGKKPNPFGLYDITGNAWEWCRDYFHQEYYAYSPEVDPRGPKLLAEKSFPGTVVLRGGGNGFRENECRSASRWFLKPHRAESYLGFRVVCELKDATAE